MIAGLILSRIFNAIRFKPQVPFGLGTFARAFCPKNRPHRARILHPYLEVDPPPAEVPVEVHVVGREREVPHQRPHRPQQAHEGQQPHNSPHLSVGALLQSRSFVGGLARREGGRYGRDITCSTIEATFHYYAHANHEK